MEELKDKLCVGRVKMAICKAQIEKIQQERLKEMTEQEKKIQWSAERVKWREAFQ